MERRGEGRGEGRKGKEEKGTRGRWGEGREEKGDRKRCSSSQQRSLELEIHTYPQRMMPCLFQYTCTQLLTTPAVGQDCVIQSQCSHPVEPPPGDTLKHQPHLRDIESGCTNSVPVRASQPRLPALVLPLVLGRTQTSEEVTYSHSGPKWSHNLQLKHKHARYINLSGFLGFQQVYDSLCFRQVTQCACPGAVKTRRHVSGLALQSKVLSFALFHSNVPQQHPQAYAGKGSLPCNYWICTQGKERKRNL